MDSSDTAWVDCPNCGSRIEIVVDCSIPYQVYNEDCEVCCRPIALTVTVNEDETVSVVASSES